MAALALTMRGSTLTMHGCNALHGSAPACLSSQGSPGRIAERVLGQRLYAPSLFQPSRGCPYSPYKSSQPVKQSKVGQAVAAKNGPRWHLSIGMLESAHKRPWTEHIVPHLSEPHKQTCTLTLKQVSWYSKQQLRSTSTAQVDTQHTSWN
eukprot:scaffold206284_cov23-Tisochrysis_lutea.AAC.1